MKHYVWQLSHVSFLLLSFSNNWEYDPPMYTVNWDCSKHYVYVIGENFFFSFDRDSTTFLILFITVYCVHTLKSSPTLEGQRLRIVTDVIIFCIHGISLLNKIKDQNLEFKKQLTTSSIREYFFFFFFLNRCYTFYLSILQRHSHENLAGITL